jgi:hypothetical protein
VRISLKLFFFFFFIFFNHFSFYLEEMGGARSGRCVTQTPNYLTQPESDLEREPRRGHLFFLVILSCYLVVKTSLLTRAATAFVSAVTTPVVQRAQKELAWLKRAQGFFFFPSNLYFFFCVFVCVGAPLLLLLLPKSPNRHFLAFSPFFPCYFVTRLLIELL